MKISSLAALLLVLAVGLAGCASVEPAAPEGAELLEPGVDGDQAYTIKRLGESFPTEVGGCVMILVQDEYRMIRCIDEGPIAGCFDPIYTVAQHEVDWSEWVDVVKAPGLRLAFLSPVEYALIYDPPQISSK